MLYDGDGGGAADDDNNVSDRPMGFRNYNEKVILNTFYTILMLTLDDDVYRVYNSIMASAEAINYTDRYFIRKYLFKKKNNLIFNLL